MQRVIVLRGTTASGKTTISKRYRNLDNKFAWVKIDNFKDFFAEDSTAALEYVNGSGVAVTSYLLDQGFSVVIDGVFQDTNAIDAVVSLCEEKSVPVKVFQLDVSLKTLQDRDKVREGVPEGLRKPLGDETIAAIYNKLQESPYTDAIKLNTEENSVDECIRIIDNQF